MLYDISKLFLYINNKSMLETPYDLLNTIFLTLIPEEFKK